jgi:hypothetical protein
MIKKAPLLMLLAIAMIAFGCKKEDPNPIYANGNPLKFTNFARCDGNQIESGRASYTLYASFEDWKAGANALVSGSAEIPVEITNPNLVDGVRYYYDLVIGDEDNWFGGNVFANSENNYSFIYRIDGNNALAPKLYSGRNDVLGDYLLTDMITDGGSIWANVDDCYKDNFLTIGKDFSMLISEGAVACANNVNASHQFYYANCVTGASETLEDYESNWLAPAGNQSIVFDMTGGQSRLTLTAIDNGAAVDFIYVRN